MRQIKQRAIQLSAIALIALTTSLAVASEEVTMKGRTQHDFWVETTETRGLDLRLQVTRSEIINAKKSVFSVLVNGEPRLTRTLSNADIMRIRHSPGPGFHRITLRSRPVIEDDSCLRELHDDAWVRVNIDSGFANLPDDDLPIATLPQAWQSGVTVENDLPDEVAATIAGYTALHRLGLSKPGPASLRLKRRQLPSHVLASLERKGDDLVLAAPSQEAAVQALDQISEVGFLEKCTGSHCLALVQKRPVKAEAKVSNLRVYSSYEPWTARGLDRRAYSFQWEKPHNWRVTGYPKLMAEVSFSNHRLTGSARIEVRVNGVPIGTFALETDSNTASLAANIPESFWDEARWTVSLHPLFEYEDCRGVEDSWVTLTAVGLDVPRKEMSLSGLHPWVESNQIRGIVGEPEVLRRHAAAVGGVLAAVGVHEFIRVDPACVSRCLKVQDGELTEVDDRSFLSLGVPNTPAIDDPDTYVLTAAGPTLELRVPAQPAQVRPPTESELSTATVAWMRDGWVALGLAETIDEIAVGATSPRTWTKAEHAQRLESFHTLWSAFVLLGGLLAGFWIWRTRRQFKRRGKEIEVDP